MTVGEEDLRRDQYSPEMLAPGTCIMLIACCHNLLESSRVLTKRSQSLVGEAVNEGTPMALVPYQFVTFTATMEKNNIG